MDGKNDDMQTLTSAGLDLVLESNETGVAFCLASLRAARGMIDAARGEQAEIRRDLVLQARDLCRTVAALLERLQPDAEPACEIERQLAALRRFLRAAGERP